MDLVQFKKVNILGQTGKLIDNIINKWMIGLRETNPAIIEMFADRDVMPYRELLPWSGEFAGKYITSAYYIYKLTKNAELYDYVVKFIDELISYQDYDGYLGCFSKECRLTGAFSQNPSESGATWDSWNHYHIMVGLLYWYDLTKKGEYLHTVERIATHYMNKFYNGNPTLVSIGWAEMNLAVYHAFGLLYRRTENIDYLNFANLIENDLSHESAGNYIYYAQQGYEFYECPKPRWESLHIIMGIVEMYRNTFDSKYLDVASQIFYSILKTDVHNTGGFSTNEQAIGNPYKNEIIETCCVVAYNALAIELFMLTEDIKILDFLERSHYNAILGSYSKSGKWSTYNTPMEGFKRANYHDINFQCRPGSPDINCCSVNAPRGVANISEWMLTEKKDCLYLNFYEDMILETETHISLKISGNYPANNKVTIQIDSHGTRKKIGFRIPAWSKNTKIQIGDEMFYPKAETYFCHSKAWENDFIHIVFDFTSYTQAGDLDYAGKSSIFVGPVLYGLELHDNPNISFDSPPIISKKELDKIIPTLQANGSIELRFSNGIKLKDFYHLGEGGSLYKTWIKVE